MLWRPGVAFILLAIAGAPAPAAAKPALTGCDAFIARLRLTASDMQVEFSHSLVVSRAKTDASVFDKLLESPRGGSVPYGSNPPPPTWLARCWRRRS